MSSKLNQTFGWGNLASWTKPNLAAIQLVDQTLSELDPTLFAFVSYLVLPICL